MEWVDLRSLGSSSDLAEEVVAEVEASVVGAEEEPGELPEECGMH